MIELRRYAVIDGNLLPEENGGLCFVSDVEPVIEAIHWVLSNNVLRVPDRLTGWVKGACGNCAELAEPPEHLREILMQGSKQR